MRLPRSPLILCAILSAATAAPRTVSAGPKKGSLVIVGGGRVGPEIVERFVSLAGGRGARVVAIPTAEAPGQLTPPRLRALEKQCADLFAVSSVTVLHTTDRRQADSKSFVEPLRRATAVWFPGGRHWRLVDAYAGTRTEREIKAVLARGGVVGGTSAGATIQGSYMVRGASGTPGNPDGDNRIMMAPGHEAGFALLRNTTIDQHLIARHRENDLVPVIAAHPGLLGIGIDESTAIVVRGNVFEVIGESKVGIYDGKDHGGKSYYFLSRGQKFNLAKRAVEPVQSK